MLTEEEINRIFSWQPYREDWPVDRNKHDDNIVSHYGKLIDSLTQNNFFDTYYSEDGGLGNYLEFICYPIGHKTYIGNAILVCVSLCSPIVAYGQTGFHKGIDFTAWGGLFAPENIGYINDTALTGIETKIKGILSKQSLVLLDKDFARKPLPDEVSKNLQYENHNKGNLYLHGIFQKTD
ncbi:MAG TPA: hypothetical protein VK484_11720 [Ferruginibacter sp.]|nr:hypothetical protein [Ferruginibacter sp.]